MRVLAVDDETGALFVASENDARLYRIDPETEAVTEGPELWARDVVGAAGGSVYVVLDDPVRIARLDGETFEEIASAEIAGTPTSARPVAGRLWVRTAERELVTMDLETLEARPEVPFDHGPGFLAEGPAGVWLTDLDAGEVARVDPETGATLTTVELERCSRHRGRRRRRVGDGRCARPARADRPGRRFRGSGRRRHRPASERGGRRRRSDLGDDLRRRAAPRVRRGLAGARHQRPGRASARCDRGLWRLGLGQRPPAGVDPPARP